MTARSSAFRRGMRVPLRSVRKRGLLGTLLVGLSYGVDRFFDLWHRTDTSSIVSLGELGLENAAVQGARRYQPTHVAPLRKLFKSLKIEPGGVLVDLGCGKGRVLLVASEFGFREVRGVEFSPALCEIARRNCDLWTRLAWRKGRRDKPTFTVIQAHALDYRFQDDEDVFYLFNPFDASVLQGVLRQIQASLERQQRKIWIVYRHAAHGKLVEQEMQPRVTITQAFWGFDFSIFEIDRRVDSNPARSL